MSNIRELSKPLFSIHTVEGEEGYYAISNHNPMFCFYSETIAGASLEAEDALSSYAKFLENKEQGI